METVKSGDLPTTPSPEVLEWTNRTLLKPLYGLIYRNGWYRDPITGLREKVVDVLCTGCHRQAKMSHVSTPSCRYSCASAPFGYYNDVTKTEISHRDNDLCPCCGAPVVAVYANRAENYFQLSSAEPVEVTRVGTRLVLLQWHIGQYVNADGDQVLAWNPLRAFCVEDKKIRCFQGDGPAPFSKVNHVWHEVSRYSDTLGQTGQIAPWNPALLEGSTAENSKLDLYLKVRGNRYPVSFLRLWQKRPSVENLLVQGAGEFLAQLIERDCKSASYYSMNQIKIPELKDINWKDKRPARMLGLNRDVFRALAKQEWSLEEWELYRLYLSWAERLDWEQDVPQIRKAGVKPLLELAKKERYPVMRTVRYLLRDKNRTCQLLGDYWHMARENGEDLTAGSVRFPQSLKTAHDNQSARQRLRKDAALDEAFRNRISQLERMYYINLKLGLLIRPVTSTEELFREGERLNHCVYSYRQHHAQGDTAIFLIRRLREPDKPYFTLELDEKTLTVRQNRGRGNRSRTSEVEQFEKAWLDFIRARRYERSASA